MKHPFWKGETFSIYSYKTRDIKNMQHITEKRYVPVACGLENERDQRINFHLPEQEIGKTGFWSVMAIYCKFVLTHAINHFLSFFRGFV